MPADRVPTGFLPPDDEEVNPEGEPDFVQGLRAQGLESLPCELLTDRSGTNYFVLIVDGKQYVLPVRTD